MTAGDSLWGELVELMKGRGVEFRPGLTESEIALVEQRFQIRFPPDLAGFLQIALPTGARFPDWRSGEEDVLLKHLAIPLEGVLFDVECNGFWQDEWGPRPDEVNAALDRAKELVRAAPTLIPIYAHRMISEEPAAAGNPVFSVHQTDIIHYGFDLEDYLRAEYSLSGRKPWPESVRRIRFWDIDRFQETRWGNGPVAFDNRNALLP